MRQLAILILALGPQGGLAACPTAADLDGGIRVLSSEGEVESFVRQADGSILGEHLYDGSDGSRYVLAHGLYVTMIQDLAGGEPVPDTESHYTYPLAPADMPVPVAGGGWDVKVAISGADGLMTEVQRYRFGPAATYTIGACTYASIPVEARYGAPPDGFMDRYQMLPDLGVALLTASGPLDAPPDYLATYIAIEALR